MFTVIGIDQSLAGSVDLNFSNIVRSEFCWITEPIAPKVNLQLSTSINVEWPSVRCCGVDADILSHSVIYSLSVAVGEK